MTEIERLARIEALLVGVGDKLDSVHAEVRMTNGRVRELEAWRRGQEISGAAALGELEDLSRKVDTHGQQLSQAAGGWKVGGAITSAAVAVLTGIAIAVVQRAIL